MRRIISLIVVGGMTTGTGVRRIRIIIIMAGCTIVGDGGMRSG